MASTNLTAAESQWREQYAAMRAALADLKLPSPPPTLDSDLDASDFEGYASSAAGQDVWDFIGEDDDDDQDSSDFVDADGPDDFTAAAAGHGAEWFMTRCSDISAKNGLSADVFQSQIASALSSGASEDELQIQLTDLVGFDDLDFIIEVLGNKDEILSSLAAQGQTQGQQGPGGHKLLTKSQRDEALRRQDYEHKSAALAPSLTREVQYPHVYKAYNAGNTLSHAGKKYGLPAGSERKQFDKYEEYFVPAGRKGTLGPGQKLVKIPDLDGLCRNTFKGYKTLNRMQSLVYPVAYKSSENMLICAPTGAVSFASEPCTMRSLFDD